MSGPTNPSATVAWRDPSLDLDARVADLLGRMTLEEKLAQLYSIWVDATTSGEALAEVDAEVAPHQHDLVDDSVEWTDLITAGLGQLTRPFGTAPIEPGAGVQSLARAQAQLVAANRFGLPAIAHEECLTGLMTLGATVYPTSLAWGATFDPLLIERMAAQIGADMARLGVHQGLAPVLDVTRDARWGRTEETIGEDPYLVGTLGTAYVRGLQSAGVIATLKHFAGYSGSRAGRNFAPVAVGPREFADVFLFPFELAVREGRAGSVMHSYAEIDGVPAAASHELLTALLRDEWGFDGTVVADYFGVSFLAMLHRVAATPAEAAALALAAGVDVELPAVRCYGAPLLDAVRRGVVAESLVDRAATRVLRQKGTLGLLDPGWEPLPSTSAEPIDLDPPASRALAREVAEAGVVLLANDGTLPLRPGQRIGLVGAQADDPMAMLGCYTFPSHLGPQHPTVGLGVEIPTLRAALTAEYGPVTYAVGCGVSDSAEVAGIDDGLADAVDVASSSDVCVVVVGDRAGLFGHGTSGEGCDAADLALPGRQHRLVEAVLATGKPVVLVLLAGRPYALGSYVDRAAAIVQAFFPGEEGGAAVAGVLTGRVAPSGRLPVSVPRDPGGQPATYLVPLLGHRTEVSSTDPTPAFAFGHGLSYTEFRWHSPTVNGAAVGEPVGVPTDGSVSVSVTVSNVGERAGTEVVQLYLHDPVAQVTRPVMRLVAYARVDLGPGEQACVDFDIAADLTSFTGRSGQRVVEPGDIELRLAASSVDIRHTVPVRLTGPERVVGIDRQLTAGVRVTAATTTFPAQMSAPAVAARVGVS